MTALKEEARSLGELIASTGLSEGQVRYALAQLIESQTVVMLGAQGVRGTTYARSTSH